MPRGDDAPRRDIKPAIIGTITEVPLGATQRLTATFRLEDVSARSSNTKRKTLEVAVLAHVDDVILASAKQAEEPAKKEAKTKGGEDSAKGEVGRKYPFLQQEGDDDPEVVVGWETQQSLHGKFASEGDMAEAKAKAVLAMLAMTPAKNLTPKEILIARRGEKSRSGHWLLGKPAS